MSTTIERVPAGTYAIDPIHSSIGFSVTHNGVSAFRSGFRSYEAKFEGGDSPRLSGSVDVESIDIAEEQFKGHILSPEFFDAENHPQLKFSSTELDIAEDGSVKLRGELEMRGEKQQIEASGRFAQLASDAGGAKRVGLSLEAAVDRRSFGLNWQMELPSGGEALGYEVSLVVELELVAETA